MFIRKAKSSGTAESIPREPWQYINCKAIRKVTGYKTHIRNCQHNQPGCTLPFPDRVSNYLRKGGYPKGTEL